MRMSVAVAMIASCQWIGKVVVVADPSLFLHDMDLTLFNFFFLTFTIFLPLIIQPNILNELVMMLCLQLFQRIFIYIIISISSMLVFMLMFLKMALFQVSMIKSSVILFHEHSSIAATSFFGIGIIVFTIFLSSPSSGWNSWKVSSTIFNFKKDLFWFFKNSKLYD